MRIMADGLGKLSQNLKKLIFIIESLWQYESLDF